MSLSAAGPTIASRLTRFLLGLTAPEASYKALSSNSYKHLAPTTLLLKLFMVIRKTVEKQI
jgi:hypothetical protein